MWPLCLAYFFREYNVLKFIHAVTYINPSSLFMSEQYSTVRIQHISFLHLPVDRHLGCFYFLSILNNAAANI